MFTCRTCITLAAPPPYATWLCGNITAPALHLCVHAHFTLPSTWVPVFVSHLARTHSSALQRFVMPHFLLAPHCLPYLEAASGAVDGEDHTAHRCSPPTPYTPLP